MKQSIIRRLTYTTYSSAMVLRMMLGGVPVSVAIPPMLAAKAVQRAKVFVRRMNCSVGVVVPRSTSLLSLKDLLDYIMPFHYYRSTDLTFFGSAICTHCICFSTNKKISCRRIFTWHVN